jgi:hypothetical protein
MIGGKHARPADDRRAAQNQKVFLQTLDLSMFFSAKRGGTSIGSARLRFFP